MCDACNMKDSVRVEGGFYGGLSGFASTSPTQTNPYPLVYLTEEQKESLSKEDQALIELGVIGSSLYLINNQYVINFLFKQNKEAIAAEAIKKVAKIKAEWKKKEDE